MIRNKGLRGGIIFTTLVLCSAWFLSLNSVMEFFGSDFTRIIATIAAGVLNLAGFDVSYTGITIAGHGFSVGIKYGCNAVYEIMVFSAAVIAYPSSVKDKVTGVLFGVIVIYIFNLVRAVLLFLTGIYFPNLFEILHENVAQNIFVFFLVILWLFWVSRLNKRDPAR